MKGNSRLKPPVIYFRCGYPSSDEDRVNERSEKARAGSLTEAETPELDSYLHIGMCRVWWAPAGVANCRPDSPANSNVSRLWLKLTPAMANISPL